jgi:hypothetical protein
MKYDLNRVFLNDEDQPLKDEKGKDFNLKRALLNGFAAGVDERGQGVTGTTKMDYYDLYVKVKKAKDALELTAAEASMALSAIKGAYPPVIAGQARDILDQKSKEG